MLGSAYLRPSGHWLNHTPNGVLLNSQEAFRYSESRKETHPQSCHDREKRQIVISRKTIRRDKWKNDKM